MKSIIKTMKEKYRLSKVVSTPPDYKLESSVRTNTFAYYVTLFSWTGFMLYSIALRDIWLMLISIVLMIGVTNFYLSQKIDKARLENLRHP